MDTHCIVLALCCFVSLRGAKCWDSARYRYLRISLCDVLWLAGVVCLKCTWHSQALFPIARGSSQDEREFVWLPFYGFQRGYVWSLRSRVLAWLWCSFEGENSRDYAGILWWETYLLVRGMLRDMDEFGRWGKSLSSEFLS